jgi:hypothetical protein
MMLLVFSITVQALILSSRPMIENGNQKMSIFNEVATSLYLYVVILLTEFMGDTGLRDEIGWGLLVLVGGVVGINLLRVLLNIPGSLKQLYLSVKRYFKGKSTVSIKPTLMQATVDTIDYSTMNHTADLFSRNPMERETLNIRKKNVIRATQCPLKDFAQRNIADEEFKVPEKSGLDQVTHYN